MPRSKDVNKDAEIEAILVDSYGEEEAAAAWEVAFGDNVTSPFPAFLLGNPVTVTGFRVSRSNILQCQVRSETHERWISVEDLDDENLPEDIAHILDLYRYWKSE